MNNAVLFCVSLAVELLDFLELFLPDSSLLMPPLRTHSLVSFIIFSSASSSSCRRSVLRRVSNKATGHEVGEKGTENLRASTWDRKSFSSKMDYLTSTIQDYQPILVGAGCLALGYMYGRHCRAVMKNQGDAPSTSDAACCAQTESFNYISDDAAVDSKAMVAKRPSESYLDYLESELTEKPGKCAKRDLGHLDVFDPHFFHKMPRKKGGVIWAQSAFKKQKSLPLKREVVRTKAEPGQDSDDEILAQRLEYFTKSVSGTRALLNKPREGDLLKLSNKKKLTADHVTNSCEAKNAQETTTTLQKLVSKGAARSLSGLGALAISLDDDVNDDQGESSLEDTGRSTKTLCPDCSAGDEQGTVLERGCQIEVTNSALQSETVTLPYAEHSTKFVTINYAVINDSLEEDLGNYLSVGLEDSDDHTILLPTEAYDSPDASMEEDAHDDADTAMLQSRQSFTRLELPTSPPPELLHVQDRCVGDKEVPLHKLLKAEIYSLLHATDCSKRRNPRWCLGKTNPISFRWFGKLSALVSSWRKRKFWRRRSKAKQVAVPAAKSETLCLV